MSSYTEREIRSLAITIIDEFGEINTTELKDELRSRMRPSGNDLAMLKDRSDDSFSQKVRNLVSHLEGNNSIANFVDVDTSVKPTIFRSRRVLNEISALPEPEKVAELINKKTRSRRFTGRIVDHAQYQTEKSEIGRKGEEFILKKEKLIVEQELGKELVKEIIHSSVVEGDGLGYDILSFSTTGIKHIEVKTTKNGVDTPFYMTYNEKMFLDLHKDTYFLYRVYDFDLLTGEGEYTIYNGNQLLTEFNYETQSYRVTKI